MSEIDLKKPTKIVNGELMSQTDAELYDLKQKVADMEKNQRHNVEVAIRLEKEKNGTIGGPLAALEKSIKEIKPKKVNPGVITKGDPRAGPGVGGGFTGKGDPKNGRGGMPLHQQMRKMNTTLRDMLIDEGMKSTGLGDKTRMARVVERIFDEAELGEAWAAQLIFERVDGKVPAVLNTDNVDTVVMVIRGASTDEL